jgi:hypothetical protein
MEPIENQQEDGKKGEKLAKKSEPRRRRLIQDIEKFIQKSEKSLMRREGKQFTS